VGPGFFAVALDIEIDREENVVIDNFTGLVSLEFGTEKATKTTKATKTAKETYVSQIRNLIDRFKSVDSVEKDIII
jgi:hypothetical protein